jgi:hypothetical protein
MISEKHFQYIGDTIYKSRNYYIQDLFLSNKGFALIYNLDEKKYDTSIKIAFSIMS